MNYKVQIVETLNRTVDMQAVSSDEALNKVRADYDAGIITPGCNGFCDGFLSVQFLAEIGE